MASPEEITAAYSDAVLAVLKAVTGAAESSAAATVEYAQAYALLMESADLLDDEPPPPPSSGSRRIR